MKNKLLVSAIAGILTEQYVEEKYGASLRAEPKPKKTCVECKAEHTHNNSWCSAKCCKTWKSKQPDKGGE